MIQIHKRSYSFMDRNVSLGQMNVYMTFSLLYLKTNENFNFPFILISSSLFITLKILHIVTHW